MSHGNGGPGVEPDLKLGKQRLRAMFGPGDIGVDGGGGGNRPLAEWKLTKVADREWQVHRPRVPPLEAFVIGAMLGAFAMLLAALWVVR